MIIAKLCWRLGPVRMRLTAAVCVPLWGFESTSPPFFFFVTGYAQKRCSKRLCANHNPIVMDCCSMMSTHWLELEVTPAEVNPRSCGSVCVLKKGRYLSPLAWMKNASTNILHIPFFVIGPPTKSLQLCANRWSLPTQASDGFSRVWIFNDVFSASACVLHCMCVLVWMMKLKLYGLKRLFFSFLCI